MTSLASVITKALGAVKTAITGAGESALSWFKEKLGIRGPSRAFTLVGDEISNGAAVSIAGQQDRVRKAAPVASRLLHHHDPRPGRPGMDPQAIARAELDRRDREKRARISSVLADIS